MTCRICDSPTTIEGERSDITLYRCRACGFVSGEPREAASTSDRYRHYYRGDPPPAPEYRYEEWLSEAERRIGRGRLLEVGAGRGGFVRVALRRGWAVCANEVSETGLEQLETTGVEIARGTVEEAGFADAHFDLVVSLEVLEHVPDPSSHLRELARVTRPGGLLLLTTPNFDGLSRRWLGIRWRVVDPGHIGYFTPRTLRTSLLRAGYTHPHVRSRSLDVSSWRTAARTDQEIVRFDPKASAHLRDAVQGRPLLRLARESVNSALGLSGLGDSLLAWASR